jgi:hypothetical protein
MASLNTLRFQHVHGARVDLILIFFSKMSSSTQALVCPDVEYVGNDHAFLQPLVVTIFFSGPVPQRLVREQIVSFLPYLYVVPCSLTHFSNPSRSLSLSQRSTTNLWHQLYVQTLGVYIILSHPSIAFQ